VLPVTHVMMEAISGSYSFLLTLISASTPAS
jgi:hypothetical protein